MFLRQVRFIVKHVYRCVFRIEYHKGRQINLKLILNKTKIQNNLRQFANYGRANSLLPRRNVILVWWICIPFWDFSFVLRLLVGVFSNPFLNIWRVLVLSKIAFFFLISFSCNFLSIFPWTLPFLFENMDKKEASVRIAISITLMIPRLSQKETKIHENELLRTYYVRIWIYLQDVPNAITHKYYIYIHKIKNAYDFYKNSYFR